MNIRPNAKRATLRKRYDALKNMAKCLGHRPKLLYGDRGTYVYVRCLDCMWSMDWPERMAEPKPVMRVESDVCIGQ